jgi:UDP-N-acetylmuramyl-tripeptide synthetase
MEVSSIALDQDRVRGVPFAAGIFTNLTHDHLDYHKTFDNYLKAKKKLFDGLDSNAAAVANAQDPASKILLSDTRARRILFGIDGEAFPSGAPEVIARILRSDLDGVDFLLRAPDLAGRGALEVKISSPLLGAHNVQNVLAAAATALAMGVPAESVIAGVETMGLIQGRLERVDDGRPFRVFVDYAHTPDGLERVLNTLRPLTRRRLIVVFGCGGDRDRAKRPKMGALAQRIADSVFVTSDNPRNEDPASIAKEILAGSEAQKSNIVLELDRRRAIHAAVRSARTGDVILIAGKGHETYQITGDVTIPFDDRAVAREALGASH